MAGYFKYFPTIQYNLDDNATSKSNVTNILASTAFIKELLENTAIYYKYQLKDTDTPDIIADKLYGDSRRHWIVLLANKLLNPQYEFPLENDQLIEYVKKKYNQTYEQSLTTIHHYELRVTTTEVFNGFDINQSESRYTVTNKQVNFTTGALTARSVPGTADTYLDLGTVQKSIGNGVSVSINEKIYAISNYTYELELNEERRIVRLFDEKYIPTIETQLQKLMQNG
jgi:Base plate wedge protein 53